LASLEDAFIPVVLRAFLRSEDSPDSRYNCSGIKIASIEIIQAASSFAFMLIFIKLLLWLYSFQSVFSLWIIENID
jgi:hypothetical protein